MTVDPSIVPGLLLLLAELVALAGVGYVIVRVALRETDHRVALAQGLVVGPAIWGVVVNLVMYALPGMRGAVAGWVFVLALAAVLVWRSPNPLRPQLRTAALFALAVLALFWTALASRQAYGIPDPHTHLGLAASIRAGLFPPELPWNPGVSAPYHYGVTMLIGLLTPPFGPYLPFGEELLSAYAWICFALVVTTALLRRASGSAVLIIAPLLLTSAGSTFLQAEPMPEDILQIAVPLGIPTAGLRSSLVDIYWPSVYYGSDYQLANITKPAFALSYTLAFVVIAHAACARRRSWPTVITLAALVGFLGLMSSTLAPIVFVLWAGLEAVHLLKSRRTGSSMRGALVRLACGLALAALLQLAGSFPAYILGDSPSGLSLGTGEYFGGWRLLGTLDRLPGGIGLIGLGPLAVAGLAVLLSRRDRLVLALAAGTSMLLLVTLILKYDLYPRDLVRLEGHARNLALFALLIALVGVRLADLRSARWRYTAGAALVGLIVWPTIAAPVQHLSLALANGVELANAQPKQYVSSANVARRRFVLSRTPSDGVAAYIRANTAVDARVFSPNPDQMNFATGRPNAMGFAGHVHLLRRQGPQYHDVLNYLEPSAIRQLGFEYVHATDSWLASLPDEAAQRLNDPNLFELLVRDESESLYRVLPAFRALDTPPAPGSYEALRRAVPTSATVLLFDIVETIRVIRTGWALSHARLLGEIDPAKLHLRSRWQVEPLGDHVPDLVVAPAEFTPWMFPPASRQPIWWNGKTAVYALNGTIDPIMPTPPQTQPFPFGVTLSEVTTADGRIAFTATFDDRAPDQWTSQDWVLVETQAPPWHLPKEVLRNGDAAIAMWFISYLNPGQGTTSLTHEFDFRAPSLAVRRERGELKPLDGSEGVLDSGSYVLAVRLRHEYKPEHWREAAIIPVLGIKVSETGEVSYYVHEASELPRE